MANRGRATVVMVAERAGVSIASVSRVLNGLATSDDVRDSVLASRRRAGLRARRRRPLAQGRAHRSDRPRRRRRRQPGVRLDDARHRRRARHRRPTARHLLQRRRPRRPARSPRQPQPWLLRRVDPQPIAHHRRAARRPHGHPATGRRHRLAPTAHRDRQRARRLGQRRRTRSRASRRAGPPPRRLRQRSDRHRPRGGPPRAASSSTRPASGCRRRPRCRSSAPTSPTTPRFRRSRRSSPRPRPTRSCAPTTCSPSPPSTSCGAAALGVPDDVAVVGMDDTDIAELVHPTLTSVDLGAARRAATAAELLLDRLADGEVVPARRITVEPSLTIREST